MEGGGGVNYTLTTGKSVSAIPDHQLADSTENVDGEKFGNMLLKVRTELILSRFIKYLTKYL